jgi:hypothetical protein
MYNLHVQKPEKELKVEKEQERLKSEQNRPYLLLNNIQGM